jgi:hypothetical protein
MVKVKTEAAYVRKAVELKVARAAVAVARRELKRLEREEARLWSILFYSRRAVKVNIKSKKMLPKYSDEELAQLAAGVGLTLEQLKAVHQAAHQTYQYIGADLAEANGGKGMDRESLVEVVLDASYMEMACGRQLTPEIKDWLRTKASKYPLTAVYGAVAAGFPYPSYE